MPDGSRKGPRNSRPPKPLPLAQRRRRVGLPPTVALRVPAAAPAATPRPSAPAPSPPPALPATAQAPAPAPAPEAIGNALLLRGDFWDVRYDGSSAIVPDSRGMRYIAHLIAQAQHGPKPLHARELVALASGQPAGPVELEARDTMLDPTAKKQLTARLEAIAAERDRASAVENFDEAERLDEEFERIVLELRHAEGSGRKGAAFTDAGERARKAVAKAIAEAVTRIAAYKEVAPLAEHLRGALRKGQWLSYTGSGGWHVDLRPLPRP